MSSADTELLRDKSAHLAQISFSRANAEYHRAKEKNAREMAEVYDSVADTFTAIAAVSVLATPAVGSAGPALAGAATLAALLATKTEEAFSEAAENEKAWVAKWDENTKATEQRLGQCESERNPSPLRQERDHPDFGHGRDWSLRETREAIQKADAMEKKETFGRTG